MIVPANLKKGIEPAERGQSQFDQGQVGVLAGDKFQQQLAVTGITQHLDAAHRLGQLAQAGTDERLRAGDDDAHG